MRIYLAPAATRVRDRGISQAEIAPFHRNDYKRA
jgi:hypothetical protein